MYVCWGRIIIHDFALISRKFASDPVGFFPYNEEISRAATPRIPDWNISILSKSVNRNFQEEGVKEVGWLHLEILANNKKG